jgi:hypothetical protein
MDMAEADSSLSLSLSLSLVLSRSLSFSLVQDVGEWEPQFHSLKALEKKATSQQWLNGFYQLSHLSGEVGCFLKNKEKKRGGVGVRSLF